MSGRTGADFTPAYLRLAPGELRERARRATEALASCELCANRCRVNRLVQTTGALCRTGARARVHGAFPHHGEEAVLSGSGGSGTIFFSFCNLHCLYCQNWEISWKGEGRELAPEELAGLMLGLQRAGCHNVNLVSPSHAVAQVLQALAIAAERGLSLPLVYNTGGYDSPEGLALLEGVVDVYMPDVKYADSEVARRLSRVPGYAEVVRAAVREMHRQVGDLVVDGDGLARRGLLVRHLVLPGGLAGTPEVMRFLAGLSPRTWVNLMAQYRPCYRAGEVPELGRRPDDEELRAALDAARAAGLLRLDPGGIAKAPPKEAGRGGS